MSVLSWTFQARRVGAVVPIVAAVGAGIFVAWISLSGQGHLALTLGIAVLLIGLAHVRVWAVMMFTLVYLGVLGDLRRICTYVFGSAAPDPLLVVGPGVAALVFAWLFSTRQLAIQTTLSKLVAVLMVWMGLQILNPAQGGAVVGLGGAMFTLIPLCWYWVGNTFGSPERAVRLLQGTLLFAVGAATLGLYQVYVGFLPFEQYWIDTQAYTSIFYGGIARPFSFFTSSQEYGMILQFASAIGVALVITRREYGVLPLVALFVFALFLAGSRGPMVRLLATVSVLWAVQGRTVPVWAGRLIIGFLISVATAGWALDALSTHTPSLIPEATLNRQVGGLTNPGESTAPGHVARMLNGISSVTEAPLGYGLGSTTAAARVFGSRSRPTEVDFSNLAVSLGLPGFLLYMAIVILTLLMTVRYWLLTRSFLALALLGVLLITTGSWIGNTMQGSSAFIWLCIGMLNRCFSEAEQPTEDGRAISTSVDRPQAGAP